MYAMVAPDIRSAGYPAPDSGPEPDIRQRPEPDIRQKLKFILPVLLSTCFSIGTNIYIIV